MGEGWPSLPLVKSLWNDSEALGASNDDLEVERPFNCCLNFSTLVISFIGHPECYPLGSERVVSVPNIFHDVDWATVLQVRALPGGTCDNSLAFIIVCIKNTKWNSPEQKLVTDCFGRSTCSTRHPLN